MFSWFRSHQISPRNHGWNLDLPKNDQHTDLDAIVGQHVQEPLLSTWTCFSFLQTKRSAQIWYFAHLCFLGTDWGSPEVTPDVLPGDRNWGVSLQSSVKHLWPWETKTDQHNQHNQQTMNNHIYLIYVLTSTMLHRRFSQFITNSINKKLAMSPSPCSLQPRDRKTEMMLWYGKGNGVIATSVGVKPRKQTTRYPTKKGVIDEKFWKFWNLLLFPRKTPKTPFSKQQTGHGSSNFWGGAEPKRSIWDNLVQPGEGDSYQTKRSERFMILPKQNKNKAGTFKVGLVGFLGGGCRKRNVNMSLIVEEQLRQQKNELLQYHHLDIGRPRVLQDELTHYLPNITHCHQDSPAKDGWWCCGRLAYTNTEVDRFLLGFPSHQLRWKEA